VRRLVISLDFDDVIHPLGNWRAGLDVLGGEPISGAKEGIAMLRKRCRVLVHSARCREEAGRMAIETWLKEKGIDVDDVVADKPLADLHVDDRGVQFKGWDLLPKQLSDFRHWTGKPVVQFTRIKKRHKPLNNKGKVL